MQQYMNTILLIILVLLLIGALPTWPYSSGWGYYPSGGLGLVLVILLILFLADLKCRLAPAKAEHRSLDNRIASSAMPRPERIHVISKYVAKLSYNQPSQVRRKESCS